MIMHIMHIMHIMQNKKLFYFNLFNLRFASNR